MSRTVSSRRLRIVAGIHRWSALVSTIFLLVMCLTGLPLIFRGELDQWLEGELAAPVMDAATPRASLDRILETARAHRPGEHVQFVVWERDEPDVVLLSVGKSRDAHPDEHRLMRIDARTAAVLGDVELQQRFTTFLLKLHTEMFAGLPGKLFLGAMGLLFIVAIVSGAYLYSPFLGDRPYGAVRRQPRRRATWLDLHNLLGIATLTWALVVGATGMMNTWVDLAVKAWQYDQLADMTGGAPQAEPKQLFSLDAAIDVALRARPDMEPFYVAFPGSMLSSNRHYSFFMRGRTPLTSRLLTPVMVDGETGAFAATQPMAWYVTALLLAQPLHFGDYGGTPLQIVWALFDLATIFVLLTGLYLWASRWRRGELSHSVTVAA